MQAMDLNVTGLHLTDLKSITGHKSVKHQNDELDGHLVTCYTLTMLMDNHSFKFAQQMTHSEAATEPTLS